MLTRHVDTCLLRPGDLPASRDDFEVIGAFNPGAIATGNGDEVVLLVRVAERPREQRSGQTPLPRWVPATGELTVDWVPTAELHFVDPRVVEHPAAGVTRLTFSSHLRVVRLPDGRTVEPERGPAFTPATAYETFGVEDPRLVRLDDAYYFTYVAVSAHGAATALARTHDFVTFERLGVVFCPENKDVVLLGARFGTDYVALHRPNPSTHFSPPEMWLAYSPDLRHWGRHTHFLSGGGAWDNGRIGAGPPPLLTDAGWLEIYHGNQRETQSGTVGAYAAGALLLDAADPAVILAQTDEPILIPTAPHEQQGFVPNVVFPTGLVQRGDRLLVYSGAADTSVGLVELSWTELRAALRPLG